MNLHNDTKLLNDTIRAAARNLDISEIFVEKDYWITLLLYRLSKSIYSDLSVFKGGTSLSKCFGLINRFSEDVDIAIIDADDKSGNEIKAIIRSVEKDITVDLKEITMDGVTSKGSRFRKTVHEYDSYDSMSENNKITVEINSFANPVPFQERLVSSMVYDFLKMTGNMNVIKKYALQPFKINVLNKEQTLLEKLVSLFRFSFASDPIESVKGKIRHFYDLHYFLNDEDCKPFLNSKVFISKLYDLFAHDKEIFDEPNGWKNKSLNDSPLLNDFDGIWEKIKAVYASELAALAYSKIPGESDIASSFKEILLLVQNNE